MVFLLERVKDLVVQVSFLDAMCLARLFQLYLTSFAHELLLVEVALDTLVFAP